MARQRPHRVNPGRVPGQRRNAGRDPHAYTHGWFHGRGDARAGRVPRRSGGGGNNGSPPPPVGCAVWGLVLGALIALAIAAAGDVL